MRTTWRRFFKGHKVLEGTNASVPSSAQVAPTCTVRVEMLLVEEGSARVLLRPTVTRHKRPEGEMGKQEPRGLFFALGATSAYELARLQRWHVSGAPVEVWRRGSELDLVQPHTAQFVHLSSIVR